MSYRGIFRKALYIFLPLFIIASSITFSLYKKEKNIIHMGLELDEKNIVEIQKETIRNQLDHIVSNLLLLSRELELHMSVWGISDESIEVFKNELILFSDSIKTYDQVRLIDKSGREVIRINLVKGKPYVVPGTELQSKINRYYFHSTINLDRNYIYLSPFDLNIEHGHIEKPFKPIIRVGTPVYDKNGDKYGILILNYLGNTLLDSFRELNHVAGRISMLVNREGYWLKGPSSKDEWGFMFEERKKIKFGNRFSKAWSLISETESGQFYNSHGIFTFTTINPIDETVRSNPLLAINAGELTVHPQSESYFWKIVSLLPMEVIAARTVDLQNKFLFTYIIILISLILISWHLARIRIQKKFWQENLEKLVEKRTNELARTNRALQKSEALYHSLVDNINEGLGMIDPNGITTYVNDQFCNIIGYPKPDIIGKHWTNYFNDKANRKIEKELKKRKDGKSKAYEVETVRKDGEEVYLRISPKTILGPNGDYRGSMALFQDITDRKIYEQTLQKREHDLGKRIKELHCLYGISKLFETKGIPFDRILTGIVHLLRKAWQYPEICCARIIFEGREFKTDNFRKTKWYQCTPVFLNGNKVGLVEVCYLKKKEEQDEGPFLKEEKELMHEVAERIGSTCNRMEVEKALAESEEKYRGFFNNAQVGLWRTSVHDGKLLECNERLAQIFGYSNSEEAIKYFISTKHYLDPGTREKMLSQINETGEINNFEARMSGKKGNPIWIRYSAKLYPEKGFLEGVATDITEAKEAMEALKKSEEQFRLVVEKSPVPMAITDARGYIEHFNSKFIEIFGWTTKDVRTPEEWWRAAYPDKQYREKVRQSWEQAVNDASIKKTEIVPQQWQLTCKNSDIRDVEFKMVPVDENRNVIAMSDITERKKSELKIRESHEQMRALALHLQEVREEERSAIARDIHDELGQVLTACKFDLFWIGSKVSKEEKEILERVKESTQYMDRAIQFVKRVATELRPALLDDMGLMAAVEWQAREFGRRTGIKCQIEYKPWRTILSKDLSTAVFRIFQEALTNVSRHSGANSVSALLEGEGDNLILQVKDNGTGLTDEKLATSNSYGIIGMKERVFPWGGNVTITGKEGEGTTVRVVIPLIKREMLVRKM